MNRTSSNALCLLSAILTDPAEARDRAHSITEAELSSFSTEKPSCGIANWETLATRLSEVLGHNVEKTLCETELVETEPQVRRPLASLQPEVLIRKFHSGDVALGRMCDALERASRPTSALVMEICYGVTSSFIVAALEQNPWGKLSSIDLSRLEQDGRLR